LKFRFSLARDEACYAAYTFGLKHRWSYFFGTLPDIQELLEPLENAISKVLIPAITEHRCTRLDIVSFAAVFWDVTQRSPNADSYRDLELEQIYRNHENEKKRLYARRVLDIEQELLHPLFSRQQAAWETSACNTIPDWRS